MADKLKVAVIGAGMIANAGHIPAWKALAKDVEVVGVTDVRTQPSRETAERYEIPHYFTDPHEMLDQVQPDIVSVCAPNVYHKESTIAALKAGAHVLCEKPVATSVAEATEMYDVAAAEGKHLMVSQTLRFQNDFIAAKDMADNGMLGEIYFAEASYLRRRGIPKWGFFHMKEHSAGGPGYDIAVHLVDAVNWIMGNPKPVTVSGMTYLKLGNQDEGLVESLAESGAPLGVFTPRQYDRHEFDVEDLAVGFVRFENDISMFIKASWAVNAPEDISRSYIAGTQGGVQISPPLFITNMWRYQVDITPKTLKDTPDIFPGHHVAAAHFMDVVRGEAEMIVKREEVLNVMRILDGLYESAEKGQEIRLD